MNTLLVTFLTSIAVAVILTPLIRKLAPRLGAVDLPDEQRRVNANAVPRLGGIAILFAFLTPMVGLLLFINEVSEQFISDASRVVALFAGSVAISILGAIDDIRNIRARYKLLVEIVIAVGAYLGGFQINTISLPFVGVMQMGIFALPITVMWIVGIINAVNLIDGLDGLAAGVAFFVCIVNFVIGMLSGNILVAVYAASLGGALVGFLVFNFNPATIFMGDTGSLLIGYILATTSLIGTKGGTAVALLVPILAMGVPIFDTLLAILRRYMTHRPIFSPDRGHLHHRLLDMGITHKKTVLIIYGISILFTATAIAIYMGRQEWEVGAALLVSSILIFVMMRAVGVFQLRKNRDLKLTGDYDPLTESIKNAMPTFILDAKNAPNHATLQNALDRFCANSKLIFAQCAYGAPKLSEYWQWAAPGDVSQADLHQAIIRHTFKIRQAQKELAFKYGWRSNMPASDVHIDLLLRVVVETIVQKFQELDDGSSETVSADSDPGKTQ